MTRLLTDERIAEIRARFYAATPGPWWDESGVIHAPDPRDGAEEGAACHVARCFGRSDNWRADAEFVAHAWEDIRDLLAEVERLKERR